jgi:hypothetical protein
MSIENPIQSEPPGPPKPPLEARFLRRLILQPRLSIWSLLGFIGPATALGRDCVLACWGFSIQTNLFVWFWQTSICCLLGGSLAVIGLVSTGGRDRFGWLVLGLCLVAFVFGSCLAPGIIRKIRD